MDSRKRVLVVEDIGYLRDTLLSVFEDEGWRADGCLGLQDSIEAIDRCTYHVAVVDIMLAGARNTDNRDGMTILRHLAELNEGTQVVVLSGADDVGLVRDVHQRALASMYLLKSDLAANGNVFLVGRIKDAMAASTVGSGPRWDVLARTIGGGLTEEAFVQECLSSLSFKGGWEGLVESLVSACSPSVPLIPQARPFSGLSRNKLPEVFSGRFWSKSQSEAIEVLLHGKNASPDAVESQWDLSRRDALYSRCKGDLSALVLACPGMTRVEFS